MKYIVIFCFLIGILHPGKTLIAGPNLVLNTNSFSPTVVAKWQTLTIEATIKNSGNSTASASHLGIYLSSTPTFTNATLMGLAVIKPLAENATQNVIYKYAIPNPTNSGNYFILYAVDINNTVVEDDEQNGYYNPTQLSISPGILPNLKLPYPIIFVHGLASNGNTWNPLTDLLDSYYGFTFGGSLRFCLNQDNNTSTANINTDFYDYTDPNALLVGDYYYVNFAIDHLGNNFSSDGNPNQSNQSAVFKQGRAVKKAVEHVLQKTGSDKVILVGHSMGGLASREYLQNASNWQSDGKHHVAKLVTIGTPHGGSNASTGNLWGDIDELSEAVRDLRTFYFTGPNNPGCYLFGGVESNSYMAGQISFFKNVDVNCNGILGQTIIGLNSKSLPDDLAYSFVFGNGSNLNGNGDGIVSLLSGNLNNYYSSLNADTFLFNKFSFSGVFHSDIHKNLPTALKGLDEPKENGNGLEINPNKLIYGFITYQPNLVTQDKDVFVLQVPQPSLMRLNVFNIIGNQFTVSLYNGSGSFLQNFTSGGSSNIAGTRNLTPGIYYLHAISQATPNSLYWPYAMEANLSPTTGIFEGQEELSFHSLLVPNPVDRRAQLQFNSGNSPQVEIAVISLTGQEVFKLSHQTDFENQIQSVELNFSSLPSGVYFYKIGSNENVEIKRFVVSH